MPSEASSAPKRSPEQIEADLTRTREEMAATLGVLSDRVNPSLVAARAKASASEKASALVDKATDAGRAAADSGKALARDVARGKPKAIAVAAAVVGLVAGAIVIAARKKH